jgi:hypothetical protein
MLRVCRPGGRVGMANWTPDSMVGDMFRAVARHVPPPPGVEPAVRWGAEERVRELLSAGCSDLRVRRDTCALRFPSAAACVDYFRTWYGPTVAAFRAVGDAGREALERDLLALYEAHNVATDGTLAVDVAYLEVVGVRRAGAPAQRGATAAG